jgi:hypothetical protein
VVVGDNLCCGCSIAHPHRIIYPHSTAVLRSITDQSPFLVGSRIHTTAPIVAQTFV